jgi:hypothetical protein
MSGISRTTADHSIIRRWAEARGGVPSRVAGTEKNMAGILRIRFDEGAELERIEWDEFFEKFDSENLALVYQEATADGEISRFCKIVSR